jgi:hypothetical protein
LNTIYILKVVEYVFKGHVRFLDYGGYATVDKDDIRVLHEKFLELPFQGVPAKLAGKRSADKHTSCKSRKKYTTLIF